MFVIQRTGLQILSFLFVVVYAANDTSINHREEKLLGLGSMFTLARFANTECERDFHTGTCYSNWDCHTGVTGSFDLFDTSTGSPCQFGFGTCCITKLGCGATSNNNNTYLRSPGYDSSFNYGLDCHQHIRIDSSVCQLRLEIHNLELAYPTTKGFCEDDYLKVNQDIKFEYLCGVTTNNHFYLDVDSSDNELVSFNFHTSNTVSFNRKWNIRVQKIMCNTDAEVMRGCGQYYTGTSGNLRGFNIDGSSSFNYLIHGLNYAACVRVELGYCKISYTEPRNGAWIPVCPDVFQRPMSVAAGAPQTDKCGNAVTQPSDYEGNYKAPHIFWLDSTDASNTHWSETGTSAELNNYGSYNIFYTQSKTC